jgi:hypothetical protein
LFDDLFSVEVGGAKAGKLSLAFASQYTLSTPRLSINFTTLNIDTSNTSHFELILSTILNLFTMALLHYGGRGMDIIFRGLPMIRAHDRV